MLTAYNNKSYRIDEIDFASSPQSKFTDSKGQEHSFVEYYKRQYNIDIKDKGQPLIISKAKKRGDKDVTQ